MQDQGRVILSFFLDNIFNIIKESFKRMQNYVTNSLFPINYEKSWENFNKMVAAVFTIVEKYNSPAIF